MHIAHARDGDREFLIGEKDRARLRAPARHTDFFIRTRIPRAGQYHDFLLQRILDRFEAQRDQRLNHRQCHRAAVQRRDRLRVLRCH